MDLMEFFDSLMDACKNKDKDLDPNAIGYCLHCNKPIMKDDIYVKESMDIGNENNRQHIGSFLSHYECCMKNSLNMFKELHFKRELDNGTCDTCHKKFSEEDKVLSEFYNYTFFNLGDKADEEYRLDFHLGCYKTSNKGGGINIIDEDEL